METLLLFFDVSKVEVVIMKADSFSVSLAVVEVRQLGQEGPLLVIAILLEG